MNKPEYTSDFEAVWDAYKMACHPASFGSKMEAFTEWVKLRPLPRADELIEAIKIQKSNDRYRRSIKEFVPIWKHFCRWIKYRCWEDITDLSKEQSRKKQVLDEAARDRRQPIPGVLPASVNIAEQFNQLIKRKRAGQ